MLRKAKQMLPKWAGRDLNSRPFGYQPNAPAKLSYRPLSLITIISSGIFKDFQNTFYLLSYQSFLGPVAESGLRRWPSEPESGGSNPLGSAIFSRFEDGT